MGQRHIGRHHSGLQARPEERVKDHLADAADLSQPAEKQQWRLQHITVEHRMRLRAETKVADLPRDHPAEKRKPQIGAHGLRHRDPVIAGRPFHRLEPLVNDHADGLVMGRGDRVTARVVRIPAPFRTSRHPDRIHAEEVAGRLQMVTVPAGIAHRRRRVLGRAVLQQHEGTQRPALGIGRRGLAGVIAPGRRILIGLAHIAELRPCKHVRALRHTRDVGLVHICCRGLDTLQLFQLHGAVTVVTIGERVPVEGALAGMPSKPPVDPVKIRGRLRCPRGKHPVMFKVHVGRDDADSETLAEPWRDRDTVLVPGEARSDGRFLQADVGGCAGMRLGIKAKKPHVVGDHHRRLG